jgi:murein DD-endopeptidase MepM/ murein hydrolase activator NlpD
MLAQRKTSMSTKGRERGRRGDTSDAARRERDGAHAALREGDRSHAARRARGVGASRVARSLAARARIAFLLSIVAFATAACVISPAGNSNDSAAQSNATNATNTSSAAATPPLEVSPFPNATATPQQGTTPAPAPPQSEPTPEGAGANIPGSLLIPVAGVRAEELRDTYSEARSEGRVHNSIDIIAPKGTPVLAAADGRVVKLFQSDKGGTTIYQRGTDGKTIYYYAHLDRYGDGLAENKEVRRGEVIGYVGDTGNATPGNFHLHFSVWITEDPKRYWDGVNLNPYPLLTGKK